MPHILIVDDSEADVFLLRRWLLKKSDVEDLTLESCDSMRDARMHIEKQEPDVILLDNDLGAEEASEVIAELREAGCASPILVVTGSLDPQIAKRVGAAGAIACVSKEDFESGRLRQLLHDALEAFGANA